MSTLIVLLSVVATVPSPKPTSPPSIEQIVALHQKCAGPRLSDRAVARCKDCTVALNIAGHAVVGSQTWDGGQGRHAVYETRYWLVYPSICRVVGFETVLGGGSPWLGGRLLHPADQPTTPAERAALLAWAKLAEASKARPDDAARYAPRVPTLPRDEVEPFCDLQVCTPEACEAGRCLPPDDAFDEPDDDAVAEVAPPTIRVSKAARFRWHRGKPVKQRHSWTQIPSAPGEAFGSATPAGFVAAEPIYSIYWGGRYIDVRTDKRPWRRSRRPKGPTAQDFGRYTVSAYTNQSRNAWYGLVVYDRQRHRSAWAVQIATEGGDVQVLGRFADLIWYRVPRADEGRFSLVTIDPRRRRVWQIGFEPSANVAFVSADRRGIVVRPHEFEPAIRAKTEQEARQAEKDGPSFRFSWRRLKAELRP